MLPRIYAIARNTLFETIRQPVFGVVLAGSLSLVAFSPAFTMFTLANSIKMVKDLGLATLLLSGLVLAVVASSTVIFEEMRKQTVLTVLSKPVGRFEFILGKYLGILAGLLITGYLTVIVLMMTVRVGVPSTVRTHLDMAAILGMAIAFALAMGGAVVLNYFFDRPFSSMAILLGLVTFTAAFWVVGLVPPVEESLVDLPFHYDWTMALAGGLVVLSTSVLASVAVAASTRLNPLMTLGICVTFFVAGVAGHDIVDRSGIPSFAADLACGLIFNLQSFWMADVLWAEREIPWQYVGRAATYALAYQGAVLFVALSLFHDREVAR